MYDIYVITIIYNLYFLKRRNILPYIREMKYIDKIFSILFLQLIPNIFLLQLIFKLLEFDSQF